TRRHAIPRASVRYQIVVRGRLSETLLTAFPSLRAEPRQSTTVLEGELADQAALFGVLAVSPRSVVRPTCLGGWWLRRPSAAPRRSDGDIASQRQDVSAEQAAARGSCAG